MVVSSNSCHYSCYCYCWWVQTADCSHFVCLQSDSCLYLCFNGSITITNALYVFFFISFHIYCLVRHCLCVLESTGEIHTSNLNSQMDTKYVFYLFLPSKDLHCIIVFSFWGKEAVACVLESSGEIHHTSSFDKDWPFFFFNPPKLSPRLFTTLITCLSRGHRSVFHSRMSLWHFSSTYCIVA